MMHRFEIFDPRDGRPIYRVPFAWLARLICRGNRVLDWERAGVGWPSTACEECGERLNPVELIPGHPICDACYAEADTARCLADEEPIDAARFARSLAVVLADD